MNAIMTLLYFVFLFRLKLVQIWMVNQAEEPNIILNKINALETKIKIAVFMFILAQLAFGLSLTLF